MELAKQHIDIGLYTNQRQAQLDFWQQRVGLSFEELVKLGGGAHQLRHSLNGSIFKLNHTREPLPGPEESGGSGENGESGYQELLIAREEIASVISFTDPDGNRVSLVPSGHLGISNIGIRMTVRSLEDFQNFYNNVLQIEQIDAATFRWGSTLFFLFEDPAKKNVTMMRGIGYRYITVQVWKVNEEHVGLLQRGGTEAAPPKTLGSTARISFILDPDDNWIEVSQRASLTGELT